MDRAEVVERVPERGKLNMIEHTSAVFKKRLLDTNLIIPKKADSSESVFCFS